METTNIHNAKTHFSKYLKKVSEGEEVVICSSNKPIAKLVAYHEDQGKRIPGKLKGQIKMDKDFDQLPQDFMKFFEE